MLDNDQNEIERIERIYDSPRDKSRVTLVYEYHPAADLLGEGGYGVVYKVTKKTLTSTKNYAIKVFDKINLYQDEDNERISRVLNEIRIHRSLNHENICKYEHSFEDSDKVYIVMEYCEKGTLASLLKTRGQFEEIEIRFYMFQVFLVLQYFRKKKK